MEFEFSCPLPNGLHARPASHIAEVVSRFASGCKLTNRRTGAVADARSVLSIISADVRFGDSCSMAVDEESAFTSIKRFVENDLAHCDDNLPAAAPAVAVSKPAALDQVKCTSGIPASPGIGQGKVVLLRSTPAVLPAGNGESLEHALTVVRGKVQAASAGNSILKAHLAILNDPAFTRRIEERIAAGLSTGQAVADTGEFFAAQLRGAESQYIRERAIDIQDLCLQLLEAIYGPGFEIAPVELAEPSVVFAETLAPRQLLALDRKCLRGLALGSAGTTSHAVILARSLGIPVLAGVAASVPPGQEVVVDANRGLLIEECTDAVRAFYGRERDIAERRQASMARYAHAPAVTADGHTIEIAANVSSAEELEPAFERGADAIGVFRTEMLFAGRDAAPPEEEQFEVYVRALKAANGRPVIIRTIDVGGDKPLPYLNLPQEANPFLGYRGVRIYPEHVDLLDAQLRAIVRASAFGNIQAMAPMVSSAGEVRWFRSRIAQIQNELHEARVAFNPAMPVGIMVEVPSIAFLIRDLCPEVDFFSIGTNDLAQYFFAADRDNSQVAKLSDVRHPGFLRLLKQIVDDVHQGGRWVGVCGEMGLDIRQLPLLVGLAVDELSGSSTAIPAVKAGLARLRAEECRKLLENAMACSEAGQVDRLMDERLPLLDSELVLLASESESKEEAIRELVDAFYAAGRTVVPQKLEECIWAREAVYSTGLGYGFAIPHCKTDAVAANTIGILKLKQPVEWGSMDGKPVNIVILLAIRESEQGAAHMKVFARLARKLMHEEFRDGLMAAPDAAAVLAQLAEVTSDPA